MAAADEPAPPGSERIPAGVPAIGLPSFWLALEFLTILRLRRPTLVDSAAIARSQLWYPVVGLLLGLALAGADRLFAGRLPPAPVAVLLLLLLEGIPGLLHLDGLADSADGLLGLHTPARRLEIMRDSATGAFGVAAIVLYLLLTFSNLESLAGPGRTAVLIAVPVIGRAAMIAAAAAAPYARRDGLAIGFFSAARSWIGPGAGGCAIAVVLLLLGPAGLLLLIAGAAIAVACALFARRRAGGITGDVLGAACELAQAAALLSAVALQPHPWFRPWL